MYKKVYSNMKVTMRANTAQLYAVFGAFHQPYNHIGYTHINYYYSIYKWQRGTILIINFSRHGNTGNKQDRYVLYTIYIHFCVYIREWKKYTL